MKSYKYSFVFLSSQESRLNVTDFFRSACCCCSVSVINLAPVSWIYFVILLHKFVIDPKTLITIGKNKNSTYAQGVAGSLNGEKMFVATHWPAADLSRHYLQLLLSISYIVWKCRIPYLNGCQCFRRVSTSIVAQITVINSNVRFFAGVHELWIMRFVEMTHLNSFT